MNDRINSCNEIAGAAPYTDIVSDGGLDPRNQPPTNDKDRNQLIQDCSQLQAEVDRMKQQAEQMGDEIWKLTQHLGQCEDENERLKSRIVFLECESSK